MPKKVDIKTPCIKCGLTNASTKFCLGKSNPKHIAGCDIDGEHMHRKCARCDYEWIEGTLDGAV